jgi:hypothetical protein
MTWDIQRDIVQIDFRSLTRDAGCFIFLATLDFQADALPNV